MLTCLADAFYGEVGIATVKVLEHFGCEVIFEPAQTCCGQPPFNSGDRTSAASIAKHCQNLLLADGKPLVIPSSSCTAMIRHGFPQILTSDSASSAFELAEFLIDHLGVTCFPEARPYSKTVVFHRACHGRVLNLHEKPESLLATLPGITVLQPDSPEQCCGFGGAFSLSEPTLSASIGEEKLRNLIATGAEEIITTDMGCVMHLQGIAQKQVQTIPFRHYAEVLAEAIA